MGLHTADAIVLRRYPYRETSLIVTCLTDGYGKLKGLVKGLRVQRSRHRSGMDALTMNRIVFYDTRTSQLHLISQCDLLEALAGLARDLDTMQAAARCAGLVDHVIPLEEPQPGVFALLKDTLERLALGGADHAALQAHFIVRLLRLIGFRPQLDACAACGAAVHAAAHWSARQGGLLCRACLPDDPEAPEASPELLAALERLAEAEAPPPVSPSLLPLLHRRLEEFLQWHLERPLTRAAV